MMQGLKACGYIGFLLQGNDYSAEVADAAAAGVKEGCQGLPLDPAFVVAEDLLQAATYSFALVYRVIALFVHLLAQGVELDCRNYLLHYSAVLLHGPWQQGG